MGLVNRQSLNATLDAVDDALFHGRRFSKRERTEAARWIAGRQGLPGSYSGMFAPTARDFGIGVRFFTGERLPTRAGTAHVLGEEACRALILLDVPLAGVRGALERATNGIMKRVAKINGRQCGTYCCGKCTVAYWRHLAVGGLDHAKRRLTRHESPEIAPRWHGEMADLSLLLHASCPQQDWSPLGAKGNAVRRAGMRANPQTLCEARQVRRPPPHPGRACSGEMLTISAAVASHRVRATASRNPQYLCVCAVWLSTSFL